MSQRADLPWRGQHLVASFPGGVEVTDAMIAEAVAAQAAGAGPALRKAMLARRLVVLAAPEVAQRREAICRACPAWQAQTERCLYNCCGTRPPPELWPRQDARCLAPVPKW